MAFYYLLVTAMIEQEPKRRQSAGVSIADTLSTEKFSPGRKDLKFSLMAVDDLTGIRDLIRYAVRLKATTTENSAHALFRGLDTGLGDYLRSINGQKLKLNNIDSSFVAGFIGHIDSMCILRTYKNISSTTKSLLYAKFVDLLRIAATDKRWNADARRISTLLSRTRPFKTIQNKTKRFDKLVLKEVQRICEDYLFEIERRILELPDRIQRGKAALEKAFDPSNIDICLALIDRFYPRGIIPQTSAVWHVSPQLARCLEVIRRRNIDSFLYPDRQDMIPFLLLTMIATSGNIEVICELSLDSVRIETDISGTYAVLTGPKLRHRGDTTFRVNNSSSLRLNMTRILEINAAFGHRLRSVADHRDRSALFLAYTKHTGKVASFRIHDSIHRNAALHNALKTFLKKHKLPNLHWRQVRSTVADEHSQRSDGSADMSHILKHKDRRTFERHYMSDESQVRAKENFGHILMLKERFERTGKIDPRQRSSSQSKAATTPGFGCLDPFDSPISPQDKGSLCSAFGRCPICPHHTFDVRQIENLAAYQALQRRILEAGICNPAAWQARWADVHRELEGILGLASAQDLEKARFLEFPLPTVD